MGATYDFRYRCYERPFRVPLQTHHGEWAVRQGIFVFLRDQETRQIGVGEIAPLPWFGTETLDEAIALCKTLPSALSHAQILDISTQLPCTQFGFGTAIEDLSKVPTSKAATVWNRPRKICGLLPAGKAVLTAWRPLWDAGHRTFKWKIGVAAIEQELTDLADLIKVLPPQAKLRLDANGGLTLAQAEKWCAECDRVSIIEYIEQPLPPDQWRSLQRLASQHQTPIALDESVASLQDLSQWCNRQWPGFYVIKPAIMGFPWAIRSACDPIKNAIICSSVFEAQIGREAAIEIAHAIGTPDFAFGFGVDHWLATSPSVSISSSIFS